MYGTKAWRRLPQRGVEGEESNLPMVVPLFVLLLGLESPGLRLLGRGAYQGLHSVTASTKHIELFSIASPPLIRGQALRIQATGPPGSSRPAALAKPRNQWNSMAMCRRCHGSLQAHFSLDKAVLGPLAIHELPS